MTSRQPSTKNQSNADKAKVTLKEEEDNQNERFPIVGMGASAGGLEAFTELLSHLPTDTGMAFVLVQHLSPNQKSLLTEILSGVSSMPVTQVQDGMAVEPNHIYVIPPNAQMTISQGVLRLSPLQKINGQTMTVDTFFISLAEEQGNKAIGVVLSGGYADGARGLETIKASGGITFAQCESSAKVNSMPSTAVASGQVDFILTPQQIAEELAKISSLPYVSYKTPLKTTEVLPESEDALSNIFSLLRSATSVDFNHYKQTTLKRRILRRMILYKLEKLEDYVNYLQNNPAEVTALYQDLLITITGFFRDPKAFEALKSTVFPAIAKDRTPNSPIRIWIAGCSTGEEAYSIAMGLLEFFSEQQLNSSIQIFATDINDVAIEKARVGIYTPSQVAEMSPERLQRFFVKVDNGYQISKTVRELCVFARQNLMSDPPFSRLDLITCRNVLIYLGSAVQKKLLPIFHYGLNSTGFLMLGTSETVGEFSDLFTLVNRKYKIYSRKMTSTPQGIDLVTSNYFPEVLKTRPIVNEDTWNNLELLEEADRIVLNQYAPVGVVINSNLEILQFRGQTSSYLEPAPGRPSFNLLKMAKQDLRIELRTTIHQSRRQGVPVKKEGVNLRDGDRIRQVTIHVIPFKLTNGGESYFLVLFEDAPPTTIAGTQTTGERTPNSRRRKTQTHEAEKTAQLQQELATTKEYLQSIIEEQQATNQDLRAANEEILSSNEELQSTNEELETAKEEIQATNEELNTINDELRRRNIESTQVSNDLQNLLSNINIPILMLGGDLRIRRFTPIAGKIFNLIPTDVGRPLSDINHNLNVPDLEIQILEVINNLNFKTQEVQDQDGHWYDLRIRPYRTIDNKIDGAVVVLVDIDALKHSAEQMRASRDYAKAIVDTVRESLVVLDVNLQVITANRCFYETFQVLPTETEQRLIFDLGNGQWNIPQLRSLLENVLPNGTPFQDLEIEHYFEQIGHKTMRFNARRMPQLDEAPRILLVIEDITHQKQLEAERAQLLTQEQAARFAAEASNRTKDEFLSTLSHELRNPLHSSLGWVQLLRQQQLDETTTNQALAAIEQSIQIQAHLIDDLLDISRISSGKLHLEVQELNLSKVIEAALEVVRFSADAKNIEIVSTLNDSPRRILGDPNRLRQILWNLLSNAIKFTPSGGTIKVTLEYVNTDVHIIVNDTGEGISPEFLPHIFERFTQADSTQKPANQGLGLGLAIVRHLVELHGGKVEAESPGKGQGSTFTVTIPLQMNFQQSQVLSNDDSEPVVSSDIPELPINSVSSLEGLRVLVVDDLANIRQVIRIILETQGVQVTAVASAQEALSTLTANPGEYDVLLSDINMPEEDGYDLIRQVRALSPEAGGEIPAVAVTSYNRESDRQAALHAGFQMHIAKPVDMNQLLFAVASLAGRWRQ